MTWQSGARSGAGSSCCAGVTFPRGQELSWRARALRSAARLPCGSVARRGSIYLAGKRLPFRPAHPACLRGTRLPITFGARAPGVFPACRKSSACCIRRHLDHRKASILIPPRPLWHTSPVGVWPESADSRSPGAGLRSPGRSIVTYGVGGCADPLLSGEERSSQPSEVVKFPQHHPRRGGGQGGPAGRRLAVDWLYHEGSAFVLLSQVSRICRDLLGVRPRQHLLRQGVCASRTQGEAASIQQAPPGYATRTAASCRAPSPVPPIGAPTGRDGAVSQYAPACRPPLARYRTAAASLPQSAEQFGQSSYAFDPSTAGSIPADAEGALQQRYLSSGGDTRSSPNSSGSAQPATLMAEACPWGLF